MKRGVMNEKQYRKEEWFGFFGALAGLGLIGGGALLTLLTLMGVV